jgi:hypothetical protein
VRPETLAELTQWVDRFAAHSEQLKGDLEKLVLALYAGQNFYDAAAVTSIGAQAANSSNAQAVIAAGLAAQYVATTTGIITGHPVQTPTLVLAALRNGADMAKVYERPVKLFRRLRARGVSPADAFARAMQLASAITDTNMTLAQRAAYTAALERLQGDAGITGYRRILHPELSRTGSCGLCIVASDQVYKTSELMPLHNLCKCTVLPIIGALDPGSSLNNLTLADLYAAAGDSTHAHDLKRVKVTVRQHGEYGPVLVIAGQQFTGLDDLLPVAA